MWEKARDTVKETFFHDEIELYKNEINVNSIGEETETEQLVGTYKCNLQYAPTDITSAEGGKSIGQTLRISLAKDFPIDYDHTYKVKIKTARIQFDDQFWKVDNWQESQISTVINAVREVAV